jgi:hypothetical protein
MTASVDAPPPAFDTESSEYHQAFQPEFARSAGLASLAYQQEPSLMAPDDENSEDLYDDEFDFVDEDDEQEVDESDLDDVVEESDVAEGPDEVESSLDDGPAPRAAASRRDSYGDADDDAESDRGQEEIDEFGRPAPVANYVVHVYEYRNFKRTIDRPFTPEDAEAFASEYNRTSKAYGRFAVAGKIDAKPRKSLD